MTQKYQVAIPRRIREALRIGAGDRIEFVITPNGVLVRRVPASDADLGALEASFAPEWDSPQDDVAFSHL